LTVTEIFKGKELIAVRSKNQRALSEIAALQLDL
jgi:hypothetical protein